MGTMQESLFAKYMRIVAVVSSYWFVSISLVFINKHLLSSDNFKIDAPLFITCFQCAVTVFLCIILKVLTSVLPSIFTFPDIHLNTNILRSDMCQTIFNSKVYIPTGYLTQEDILLPLVLPLSIIFVAMITFNNLCLKFVGVPFYYIGRSLTTVFNVILTFTVLHLRVSLKALACCIVIIFGFILGVNEEGVSGSLSVKGVIYGILASFFVSLYSIYMKKILPVVEGSIWRLTYYNNINAIALFLPLMLLFGEVKTVFDFELLGDIYFWILMIIGGTFGFAIGYVTGLQIKVTSPLTHNISGTAKACAQTVAAVAWFQEEKSLLWWISNTVVLLGSAAYTRVRQLEMMAEYHRIKSLKDLEKNTSEKSPV